MAEKKDIARLDFKVDDAIKNLDKIDQKLKEVSDSSEAYAKNIGQNLSNAINSGVNVDTKTLNNGLNQVSTLTKTKAEQLAVQLQKIEAKKQADISVVAEKGEQARQTAAYKSALKQEEYNNRVLKSSKTLYDKITEYAKTYVIYQGFNQLRQAVSETIDEMVDLEYQMVQIDRVLNDSSLNIDNYRDKLIQLAYDYGNTFDNVADITLRLAQAGYDTEESLALSEKTLLALNTAELNATQATEDMVAVMAQWGLMTGTATEQADNYGKIIDKVNKVADNFPITSEDIMEALKKTSSAFNLAGATIDETIATIVAAETASQRGGKAIGTALSNIIQQLKEAKKIGIAESLGISFYTDETKTEFKDIMEIFTEMSEKMQQLKNAGKENSVEMQNLLSIFTVFRRNIGSSLLGEMSGEDSTYLKVLETSLNSVGYSLQENEKHMQTAQAAQNQFNATLLELKTKVWDGGVENVYRNMLNMGTNLVDGIGNLIDKIGLLPTSIGAVTAVITALKTNIKSQDILKLTDQIKDVNNIIRETKTAISEDDKVLINASDSFKSYAVSVGKGKASLVGYTTSLITSKVATIAMTAATIALNAAITAGLTIAITWLAKKINDTVNAQEKYINQQDEIKQAAEDNAAAIDEEINKLDELTKQYKELASKTNRTSEEDEKIYELQSEINDLIQDSGTQVDLVTEKVNEQGKKVLEVNQAYDEQLEKIKSVRNELSKEKVNELKTSVDASQRSVAQLKEEIDKLINNNPLFQSKKEYANPGNVIMDLWDSTVGGGNSIQNITKGLESANIQLKDFYTMWNTLPDDIKNSGLESQLRTIMTTLDTDEAVNMLDNLRTELQKIKTPSEDVTKAIGAIGDTIDLYQSKVSDAKTAIEEYKEALSELYKGMGFATDYSETLRSIWGTYSDLEKPRELIESIETINTDFANGKINIKEYFDTIQEKISEIDLSSETEELEAYQAIFAMTAQSMGSAIETIRAGFETDTIDFTEYSSQMGEAAENLLELYTKQAELVKDEQNQWKNNTEQVDEFATSLQEGITTIQDMSGVLNVLHENMTSLGTAASSIIDDGKIQAQELATLTTAEFEGLTTNITNALNGLKETNNDVFNQIVDKTTQSLGIQTENMLTAEGNLQNGFLNNYNNMAATIDAVTSTTEGAVTTTSQALGKVIEALADTIENFSYEISGSINKINWTNLYIQDKETPIKVPEFTLSITGKDTSKGGISSALRTLSSFVSNYDNSFKFKPPKLTSTGTSGPSTTSNKPPSSSGTSSGSSSKDTSAEDAAKAEEEAYKKRLSEFEDYIDEKERLEERWVNKQKELGQLSNNDYLYITQQRIERYKKYLEEVKNATWMNEEDKLKLTKEYSEKIEDLQIDYLGYLKDKLDDEIDALKEANEEKIQLIKDEASAKIAALQKVEDENDRIREKEEYEKKRQNILEDISYWEQRTGREAQEALKEAKENLKELDEEWKQQLEDWSIEDQIQAIEDERDAQIKAIEDSQAAEIESIQAVYDAKVKLFAETGQIIYENSVIQSQALYNAYKSNFIDPISSELASLNKAASAPVSAPAQQQQYETYLIKSGDTLSAIAKKYGTTVEKIMAANPYITNKNKIYAGKTLQIPKFHEGGIVGGNQEAFALLKPNEVILKTEWAASLNRMMKYFDNVTTGKTNGLTNNPAIEVKGNLIQIDADIKSKSDVDYLERRIEKMLKSKFNIKK